MSLALRRIRTPEIGVRIHSSGDVAGALPASEGAGPALFWTGLIVLVTLGVAYDYSKGRLSAPSGR